MNLVTTRKILSCALLGAAAFCTPAFADQAGPYVDGALGGVRLLGAGESQWGSQPTGSLGYAFANGLRPEIELSQRYNSDNGSIRAQSVMGNLWYDIWSDEYYFYAGGGVGKSHLRISGDDGASAADNLGVWQLGFGFGSALTQKLALGMNFRHFETFDHTQFNVQDENFNGARYKANTLSLELRYSFWGTTQSPDVAQGSQPVQVVPVR